MFPRFQPTAELQLYRLTDGAENYGRDEGLFEVRYADEVKQFSLLISAYKFYAFVSHEAKLYDVTNGEVLIEVKRYLPIN